MCCVIKALLPGLASAVGDGGAWSGGGAKGGKMGAWLAATGEGGGRGLFIFEKRSRRTCSFCSHVSSEMSTCPSSPSLHRGHSASINTCTSNVRHYV